MGPRLVAGVAAAALALACGGAPPGARGVFGTSEGAAGDPGLSWAVRVPSQVVGFAPTSTGRMLALSGGSEAVELSASGALIQSHLFAPGFEAEAGAAIPGSDATLVWGRAQELSGVFVAATGIYEPSLEAFLVSARLTDGCRVLGAGRDADGRRLISSACGSGLPSVTLTADAQGQGAFTLANAVTYLSDVGSASAAFGRAGALAVALTLNDPTYVSGQRLGRRSGLVVFSVDRSGVPGEARAVDASGVFAEVLGVDPPGNMLIKVDHQDVARIVSVSGSGAINWSIPAASKQVMLADGSIVLARQDGCSFDLERSVNGATALLGSLRLLNQPTVNCDTGVVVQALSAADGAVYVGGRFVGDVDFAGTSLQSASLAGFVLRIPLSSQSR